MNSQASNLEVNNDFVVGIDVGATKVHILDSLDSGLHRYITNDYPNLYTILEYYFDVKGMRPRKVVIDMSGPRDDETGAVQPTNYKWPVFSPEEAERKYPGTKFETLHDVAAVIAGSLHAGGVDLKLLKPGKAKLHGPAIAVTIGTGVGVSAAIWDGRSKHYVYFSGEAGHMGFQPYNDAERRHLDHIFTKFDHPSAELAVNGKHGIQYWLEHSSELNDTPELENALFKAHDSGNPLGAVLLAFATEGQGSSCTAARNILNDIGALVGNILADFALVYRSTGGIYLTGSVSMGLAEYWAENSDLIKAFVRHGTTDHALWLEEMLGNIPIYLVNDPNIAVAGSLALAREI